MISVFFLQRLATPAYRARVLLRFRSYQAMAGLAFNIMDNNNYEFFQIQGSGYYGMSR